MTAYAVMHDMEYTEFLKWIEFFRKHPVGWQEDQRTYLLMRAQGVKEKGENIFPSLRAIKDAETLRSKPDKVSPSGKFLEMMMKAKNGDPDWKPLRK